MVLIYNYFSLFQSKIRGVNNELYVWLAVYHRQDITISRTVFDDIGLKEQLSQDTMVARNKNLKTQRWQETTTSRIFNEMQKTKTSRTF